jgi:hypothetical protein
MPKLPRRTAMTARPSRDSAPASSRSEAASAIIVEAASYFADQAVAALWAAATRKPPNGDWLSSITRFQTVDQFHRSLTTRPGQLVSLCRLAVSESTLLRDEREPLAVLIRIADAADLRQT